MNASSATLPGPVLEPSDRYGWHATSRNALPLLGLLWLAPHVADRSVPAAWLIFTPLVGLFLYRLTIVMHDCTHATLFRLRRTNKAVGGFLGAVTGVDFVSFSTAHWRHHRLYGKPGDPQLFHYAALNDMRRRQFLWHTFKPLLGLNLRHTFAESVLAPANIVRLARSGDVALLIFVQAAILTLVTGGGRHVTLAALPFLSAATVGLFLSQLRGMAEHGPTNAGEEPGHVRTHQPRRLDRTVLYDLHFNYHEEHHAQPHVPSRHLGAVHHAAAGRISSAGMLGTLWDMYIARQPEAQKPT